MRARMNSKYMGARIKLGKALSDWRGLDIALKYAPKKYAKVRSIMEKELKRAEKRKQQALEVLK